MFLVAPKQNIYYNRYASRNSKSVGLRGEHMNSKCKSIMEEYNASRRDFAELAMNTLVEMKNLKIVGVSTTTNEDSSNYGAMTFTCQVDGKTVKVRTVPLKDADGNLLTKEDFLGKTISVKGIVDFFGGDYQIKVFSVGNITVVE